MSSSRSRRKFPIAVSDVVILGTVAAITAALLFAFPENAAAVRTSSSDFFLEMISVLPAVVILMGLFSVFVSKDFIVQHLGSGSGVKGFLLAVALGSLPTGPLYVAFPLVRAMRAKGAGTANMIGFLTAWASIKLPQEIVEMKFLGPSFTLTRLVLTLSAAAIMGVIAQSILDRWENGGPAEIQEADEAE